MKAWVPGIVIALAVASLIAGCEDLVAGIEDQIVNDIIEGNENIPVDPGVEPDPTIPIDITADIDITNIIPARGLITGGELIEIIGYGFEPGMEIEFMPTPPECEPGAVPEEQTDPCGKPIEPDVSACGAAILSAENRVPANPAFVTIAATRIICQTPLYPFAPGPATVVVHSPAGTPAVAFKLAVEPNGFTFYDPIEIFEIDPTAGPAEGGTLVTIIGLGFDPNTIAVFGNGEPQPTELVDSGTLTVMTPPMAPGLHPVTVANFYDAFTLEDAFLAYGPVEVHRVDPIAGPLDGGTEITVHGLGFIPATELWLGSVHHTAQASSDQKKLTTTTLAAGSEGPVVVVAGNEIGEDTLADGFIFYDRTVNTPRLIWMSPTAGDSAGGQVVTMVIGGFTGTATAVAFGGAPAACIADDDYVITCTTPPGTGTVDIQLDDGAAQATIEDAFRYIDLRIDSVLPDSGAIAGGTYLHLYGQGFGDAAEVFFDGVAAARVEVLGDGELVLRTPPGDIGPATIRVETDGVSASADGLFSFFNPFTSDAWVAGGPIDGNLHIRVIDERGAPVPEAYVIVGRTILYGQDHLHGFTDHRGQITVSDPELVGPQDIHAGKEGYGAFSFIQINRDVVTLTLLIDPPPQADPLPPCPPSGGGGAPPLITGRVHRIKDDFNTGNDTVQVVDTFDSYGAMVNGLRAGPGPNSSMISQGTYELISRAGDIVVIAMAGYEAAEDYLDVHGLGFHPFLYVEPGSGQLCDTSANDNPCCAEEECVTATRLDVEPGSMPPGYDGFCTRVYPDIDITIDTAFDQPLRIDLVNPPYARADEVLAAPPTTLEARIYYDFGYQGLHPIDSFLVANVETLFVDLPEKLPEVLGTVPFSLDLKIGVPYGDTVYTPLSETRLRGLTSAADPISVEPLLKTHNVFDVVAGNQGGPYRFSFLYRPDDIPDTEIHGNMHFIFDVEYVVPCAGAFPIPQVVVRWWIFTAGDETSLLLPVFPPEAQGANIPDGQHYWQLESYYSPGAPTDFNQVDYQALMEWRSRSRYVGMFTTPPPAIEPPPL